MLAPQGQLEAELQAARNRAMHLEAELLAVQEHMRKFRRSHDAISLENADLSTAVYKERARALEAQAALRVALDENARLREETAGAPTRQLRSVPPLKRAVDGDA